MADHFIGINRGKDGSSEDDFTFATTTQATDVEVRIADAAGWTRLELILALEGIIRQITSPAESPDAQAKFPVL